MTNLIQVYIVAVDGFIFDMEKVTEEQARKIEEWTFGGSDEIRGFKRITSSSGTQLVLKIPGTQYNDNTFEFFNQLWLENENK